ncbi:YsaB family lipoprotein [Enterobacter sp.]|uniref:YsaB family lipoprotein n=1 Tax=Enterobacter sp. TaxID=42895 RepID=UPI002980D054|nr:YsaB family lipoprotein [Enterobacter sp.]
MMMKCLFPALLCLLAGCSSPTSDSPQKAQVARVSPARTFSMEQLCKETAAHRYNTGTQNIAVTRFERFQASYEMRGFTPRDEGFVCAFDTEGQFLHLSMR